MENITLISHNPISKHLNVFCNNLLRFPNVTRVVEHVEHIPLPGYNISSFSLLCRDHFSMGED